MTHGLLLGWRPFSRGCRSSQTCGAACGTLPPPTQRHTSRRVTAPRRGARLHGDDDCLPGKFLRLLEPLKHNQKLQTTEPCQRTHAASPVRVVEADAVPCRLQSTDGHSNNWSFSTTRLNWHVAELAARCGGVLLVDATRSSTKRFPDALSKTVPIWAATLNLAVATLRDERGWPPGSCSTSEWRSGVALPPWVGENEAVAINARLPEWTAALTAVGADVAGLSAALAKPLRVLWLSQASPMWGLPDPSALQFTPLICVSASAPMSGHGHRRTHDEQPEGVGPQEPSASRAYSYVPGAGDDEEAWSRGLTPELFWRHRAQLLRCDDVLAAIDKLAAPQPAASGGTSSHARQPNRFAPRAPALSSRATGLHDLPPAGIGLFAANAAAASGPPIAAGGVRWLADTRIGCASFALLRDPSQLWRTTDALLLCDDEGDDEATSAAAAALDAPAGAVLCVRVARAKVDRESLAPALTAAVVFADAHLAAGRTLVIACPDGVERAPAVAVALLAACFTEEPAAGQSLPLVRFSGKALPCAAASKVLTRRWLAFVSAHHADARPTRGLLKQAFQWLCGGATSDA